MVKRLVDKKSLRVQCILLKVPGFPTPKLLYTAQVTTSFTQT